MKNRPKFDQFDLDWSKNESNRTDTDFIFISFNLYSKIVLEKPLLFPSKFKIHEKIFFFNIGFMTLVK